MGFWFAVQVAPTPDSAFGGCEESDNAEVDGEDSKEAATRFSKRVKLFFVHVMIIFNFEFKV